MFPEHERKCFRYFDGRADVYGDPLEVQRELVLACDGKFHEAWEAFFWRPAVGQECPADQLAAKTLLAAQAGELLVAAARRAFRLEPFDRSTGQGATEADAERALRAWSAWCALQKKTSGTAA